MTNLETNAPMAKWKIAIIPVLVGVLAWRLFGSSGLDEPSKVKQLAEVEDLSGDSKEPKSLLQQLKEERRSRTWPKRDLAEIAQHDPFALTGELKQLSTEVIALVQNNPTTEAPLVAEEPTLKSPVQAIIHGPNGAAAIVENKIVRVGDFVDGGFQVVAIESNAIVVQAVQQK
jgi:hypothetical protein